MRRGAGPNAVVASHAAVKINEHCHGAIDKALLECPFHRRIGFHGADRGFHQRFRWSINFWKNVFLDNRRRYPKDVDIAERSKRGLQRWPVAIASGPQLIKPELVARTQIGKCPLASTHFYRYPGEAGPDHQEAVRIMPFLDDYRLVTRFALFAHPLVGDVPVKAAIGFKECGISHFFQLLSPQTGE